MNYYQFNISDYRKDTHYLSQEEHYIYRSLLDECYLQETPLTDDKRHLMRILRLTSDQKDVLEWVLDKFFELTPEGWVNDKVNRVLSMIYEKSDKARESANARWSKCERKANAGNGDANAMRTHSEGNADAMLPKYLIPNTKHKEEIPEAINPTAWLEFEQHRKEMRQPLTDLARTKAMNVIIDLPFCEQAKIIDKTIQNRWKGLFLEKTSETNKRTDRPEPNHARVMRKIQADLSD